MPRPTFRFAPSPNGFLHLGHACSALLNTAMARAVGGLFRLRIEDIDPDRSDRAFEAAILEDLAWLGLDWERPVRRQSEHLGAHAAALETLKRRGLVYPCACTRGQTRAAVAVLGEAWPRDPDGAPLYPGLCRIHPPAAAPAPTPVWRLDMARALAETGPLGWEEIDGTGGAQRIEADPLAWGDVVVARRDIRTSYHLAVVMDDAAEGVTHVVRGRDLYHATAIHRVLQSLLGLPEPLYRHHDLVLDAFGRKLSKSAGAQSLRALREKGLSPDDVRRMIPLECAA